MLVRMNFFFMHSLEKKHTNIFVTTCGQEILVNIDMIYDFLSNYLLYYTEPQKKRNGWGKPIYNNK